jgi:pimeloyl-ACP methyl ester carboxylesterase
MMMIVLAAALAQAGEPYNLRTARGSEAATLHRIDVPENRARPEGPRITLAVVRWPATAAATRSPVIYLAGGPGQSGIAAAQVSDTYDVLQRIRRTADVLLLDQRGTGQSVPRVSCPASRPLDASVFESSAAMQRALEPTLRDCLGTWRARGIDLSSYNTEASADDVADVARALKIPRLGVFGFSYGTHLAASVVRRHPDIVDRVVFAGFEGPDDNEKYPAVYDRQVAKISALAAAQPDVAVLMPDFAAALKAVLAQAARQPFTITVQSGGMPVLLRVGKDGLLYLLRRDIGDTNDLPVFPKMIWQLSRGETTLLTRYAERRYNQLGTGVSLMSLAMDCASGASSARHAEVAAQLPGSIFGEMTNPLPGLCGVVGVPALTDTFRLPIATRVPSLFVSGTLDSNTPPEQVERARPGFAGSTHLVVEHAGHESTLIAEVADAIGAFFRGAAVTSRTIKGPALRFDPLR